MKKIATILLLIGICFPFTSSVSYAGNKKKPEPPDLFPTCCTTDKTVSTLVESVVSILGIIL